MLGQHQSGVCCLAGGWGSLGILPVLRYSHGTADGTLSTLPLAGPSLIPLLVMAGLNLCGGQPQYIKHRNTYRWAGGGGECGSWSLTPT